MMTRSDSRARFLDVLTVTAIALFAYMSATSCTKAWVTAALAL